MQLLLLVGVVVVGKSTDKKSTHIKKTAETEKNLQKRLHVKSYVPTPGIEPGPRR